MSSGGGTPKTILYAADGTALAVVYRDGAQVLRVANPALEQRLDDIAALLTDILDQLKKQTGDI